MLWGGCFFVLLWLPNFIKWKQLFLTCHSVTLFSTEEREKEILSFIAFSIVTAEYILFLCWGLANALKVHHNWCSKYPPSSWTHTSQRSLSPDGNQLFGSAAATLMLDHRYLALPPYKLLPLSIPKIKMYVGPMGRTWRPGDGTSTPSPSVRKAVVKPITRSSATREVTQSSWNHVISRTCREAYPQVKLEAFLHGNRHTAVRDGPALHEVRFCNHLRFLSKCWH
jgi:hypothetical protein